VYPAHDRYEDMDPAARREFFGRRGRKGDGEPDVTPTHGNGIDKPWAPDPNHDHSLSTRRSDRD
jgi:hypothetical protein